MDNVTFVDKLDEFTGVTTTYAIIDRGNGEYTSMPKAVWDEQQKSAELGGTL